MVKGSDFNRDPLSMRADEYTDFCEFLRESCGINLGASKQYLVSTRVRRILEDQAMVRLGDLNRALRLGADPALRQRVIDAMTTNETFWFRDGYPFRYLAESLLPERARQPNRQPLRIWSAACSTGQEPYSISMVYREFAANHRATPVAPLEVLGTDLSSGVLETAKGGIYDKYSLARGLSDARVARFFSKVGSDMWQINPEVAQAVRFRAFNLRNSFTLLGRFDAIFCRNVLIYFTSELKCEILTKMHAALNPGGYLFLGSSESIVGVGHLYEMVPCPGGVIYRALDA